MLGSSRCHGDQSLNRRRSLMTAYTASGGALIVISRSTANSVSFVDARIKTTTMAAASTPSTARRTFFHMPRILLDRPREVNGAIAIDWHESHPATNL